MMHSEQINELAAALANAQGEIAGALKDSENPFYKSRYADLASVWAACRGPLSKAGLAVIQVPSAFLCGEDQLQVTVETLLAHSSGQWVRGEVSVITKGDPQAVGSAVTYLRRYAVAAFVGVAPEAEDDDAEAAQGRGLVAGAKAAPVAPPMPPKYESWLVNLQATIPAGTAALQMFWKNSGPDHRTYLLRTAPKSWEAMKAAAAKVSPAVPA